jgi:hypothetical protein
MAGCAALALALSADGAAAQRSLFDTPLEAPAGSARPASAPAAAAPAAPTAEAPAETRKPRARAKPRGPVPARSLTIHNASPNTLTGLEVTGDGKSARLAKPLKPKGRTTLRLPALKTCTVTIAATFETGAPEPSELDICKEKTIRFTDS